ncbi:DUF4489 domain-containing protein [Clostridium sp. DSM 100503]|uniref:DUF4489 domain-containing protein n=1 Tax=Clostridium sp. DSM 100503 TaxID=2963282 RepID=UPI002149A660|nr:DUF4489 domain-containing protein [Clostridium sp. DSM 100503]MCR1950892.1 DUF4489 domain-containing protein [Clostridium sp. DSM 100503]
MNSMSRRYQEQYRRDCEKDYRRDCEKDYRKDHEKEEEKCPTIIKCGCPSSTPLPVLAAVGPATVTLTSLTVDTSCICDPIIKLDFSSVFTTIAAITIGGLSVQVFKQCRNQITPVPVGPVYPVLGGLAAVVLPGAIFTSFSICDSDSCDNDCCTYTAVATIVGPLAATVGASFTNSNLIATITCKSNACSRKCHKKCDEKYYY